MTSVSVIMSDNKQVILVTGSSGFIGQHIIKHLQENDRNIKEIRCLDLKPYENTLGHANTHAMKVITGDITNEKIVMDAMREVDVVFHAAAIIDTSFEPNENLMRRVNVDGTSNLLNAAVECCTRYFIHISTVDVVIGDDQIYFGSETTTPLAKNPILGPYATTKQEAEKLVLAANGRNHSSGMASLQTLILRPTVTYGEGDPYFIPQVLKNARANKGMLPRIDNIFIRAQVTYAGNVAWCALRAKDKLREDSSVAGEVFFVTDDTPIVDPFDFYQPILKEHGMRLSKWAIPYWILMMLLYVIVFFVRLIKPLYEISLPEYMEIKKIRFICNTFFFNRNKAILRLDYDPFYTAQESEARAMAFYKQLKV